MNRGFWDQLEKPILMLAPMYDVTDSAFRQIIAKYGKPPVMFTEFVSADGLQSVAQEKLSRELYFTPSEQPLVAQIFGANPKHIYQTAKLVAELGFAGLDLNMGCPERNVIKQGACSDLIRNPGLAQEIIQAAKDGAGGLPVSVKTRIGFNQSNLEEWCGHLLEARPAAITFHWRTKKEESKVEAHWDQAPLAIQLARGTGVLIFGNGDVPDCPSARAYAATTGVDGVMLGRAIFGNPWLFSDRPEVSLTERLEVMVEHTKLFEELYGETETNQRLFGGHRKNFAVMKKHYKAYAKGFLGAHELREALMGASNAQMVADIVATFLKLNQA